MTRCSFVIIDLSSVVNIDIKHLSSFKIRVVRRSSKHLLSTELNTYFKLTQNEMVSLTVDSNVELK